MASKQDYYEILGVSKNDSKEDIKKAYKKLAMKYHPDRVSEDKKDESEKKFKEINEAYSILGDENKKQQYDSYGHDAFSQGAYQGGHQGNPFQGEDISDMFRNIFGRDFFGGSGENSYRRSIRGEDLQYELIIDFEEAAFGCEKQIKIRQDAKCDKCKGTGAKNEFLEKCMECNGSGITNTTRRTPFGAIRQEHICEACDGRGNIPKENCQDCHGEGIINMVNSIEIKIPQGINDEQVLRVRNKGNSIRDGENGDLLLIIRIRPHKIFRRDEDDIYMELPITFSQAALGCKISVPTLTGDMKIKIAAGTQSGTLLRLKDKGIENINHYRVGDQFINIKVETPKKLDKKQKILFKELSNLE